MIRIMHVTELLLLIVQVGIARCMVICCLNFVSAIMHESLELPSSMPCLT